MTGNNNVQKIRRQYEKHALAFLQQQYPFYNMELEGHTRPGSRVQDIRVHTPKREYYVEVKGSNLIDVDGPKWQRVKLSRKDWDSLNPAAYFLFVFDQSQLGMSGPTGSHCEYDQCSGGCNYSYRLVATGDLFSLIKKTDARSQSIPIIKIVSLKEVWL